MSTKKWYHNWVRSTLTILAVALSAVASADRLLNVPVARSLPANSVRAEYLFGANDKTAKEQFLGFSLFSGFDIELRNRNRTFELGSVTADLAYNLVAPVQSVSPGISVGMLDAANNTFDGRRGFVALTFREALDIGLVGESGDFTIGAQFGSLNSGFWGASLPLSGRTRFIVENNGARLSAGIESNLVRGLNLRVFTQENLLLAGLSFSQRF